jgi:hypothetical protein
MGNGCSHGHDDNGIAHLTASGATLNGHIRKDSVAGAGAAALTAANHASAAGLIPGTPSYYAAIVRELILTPAAAHETYSSRMRAIMEVVDTGHRDHPSLDLQLFARMLSAPDGHGWTIVHHAASKNFKDDFFAPLLLWLDPSCESNGSVRLRLIEARTTRSVGTFPAGCTALHIAIARGALEAMRFLLHSGAWPGMITYGGESCVAFILRAPDYVQRDILDDFQLAINEPSHIADMLRPSELAPVFALAARFDYFPLAWALLRHGADPSVVINTRPIAHSSGGGGGGSSSSSSSSHHGGMVRRSLFSVLLLRTLESKEAREKQIIELVHLMLEHGARIPPIEADNGLLHELLSYQHTRGKVVHHYLALLVAAGCEPKLETWRGPSGSSHSSTPSTHQHVHVGVSGITSSVSPAERLAAVMAALRQAISDGHIAEAQCHRGRLSTLLRMVLPSQLTSLTLSYFPAPTSILLASLGLPPASPDIFQLIRAKFIRYR